MSPLLLWSVSYIAFRINYKGSAFKCNPLHWIIYKVVEVYINTRVNIIRKFNLHYIKINKIHNNQILFCIKIIIKKKNNWKKEREPSKGEKNLLRKFNKTSLLPRALLQKAATPVRRKENLKYLSCSFNIPKATIILTSWHLPTQRKEERRKYFLLHIFNDALFVKRLKHFFLCYKPKHQADWDVWDFPHPFWLLTNCFGESLPDIYDVPRANDGLNV